MSSPERGRLFSPLTLTRGPAWANRLALAPLTNWQSHEDGRLSDAEFHWLTRRAQGGFGMTMTCAAFVHEGGKGFPGQLGAAGALHEEGLARLAEGIRQAGSVSALQLQHSGMRALPSAAHDLISPSDDAKTGARAMTGAEVEAMVETFVDAAKRAEKAGFDGVELHGAHGYLLCAFLSPKTNRREDEWGGSPEKRARILRRIIDGVRQRCRPDFQLGVRLSPERWGMVIEEVVQLAANLMASGQIDYLDMSLWDAFKRPHQVESGPSLIEIFSAVPRNGTRLGVAGKIRTPQEAEKAVELGVDFLLLGRAGIVDADYPKLWEENAQFVPTPMPAPAEHLAAQAVSPPFLRYLSENFPDTVANDEVSA